MKPYNHLNQHERYQISAMKALGQPIKHIAGVLNRHPSTIARELARHSTPVASYCPQAAQAQASSAQSQRRNARQIPDGYWLLVLQYLGQGMSPEQISGRLMLEQKIAISHESIYLHIYEDHRLGGQLVRQLRCQKARRKRYGSARQRRGTIKGRVCISQRPIIVDHKTRLGDWEGDTIVGQGHQGVLVTLTERKSRFTLARRVNSKHAPRVAKAIIKLLKPHKGYCHTLTFDNGCEFAQHALIAQQLEAKVYFAHPYCSWERGLNENTNGLLRQYFPKSTNFKNIPHEQVEAAVHALNHRPRKCLNYKTPYEVFFGLKMQPFKLLADALCA